MSSNKSKYGEGYHVLVVDDEEKVAKFISEMLKNKGYTVTTLHSSQAALDFFKANQQAINLMITDQTMPELTGAELAQSVLEINPDLPIFLATGFSEEIDEERATKLGIKEYMAKPIKLSELGEKLLSYLPAKTQSQSA